MIRMLALALLFTGCAQFPLAPWIADAAGLDVFMLEPRPNEILEEAPAEILGESLGDTSLVDAVRWSIPQLGLEGLATGVDRWRISEPPWTTSIPVGTYDLEIKLISDGDELLTRSFPLFFVYEELPDITEPPGVDPVRNLLRDSVFQADQSFQSAAVSMIGTTNYQTFDDQFISIPFVLKYDRDERFWRLFGIPENHVRYATGIATHGDYDVITIGGLVDPNTLVPADETILYLDFDESFVTVLAAGAADVPIFPSVSPFNDGFAVLGGYGDSANQCRKMDSVPGPIVPLATCALPTFSSKIRAVAAEGHVYVLNPDRLDPLSPTTLSADFAFLRLNPDESWTTLPNPPESIPTVVGARVAYQEGRLIFAGGLRAAGPNRDLFVYHIENEAWTNLGPLARSMAQTTGVEVLAGVDQATFLVGFVPRGSNHAERLLPQLAVNVNAHPTWFNSGPPGPMPPSR